LIDEVLKFMERNYFMEKTERQVLERRKAE